MTMTNFIRFTKDKYETISEEEAAKEIVRLLVEGGQIEELKKLLKTYTKKENK